MFSVMCVRLSTGGPHTGSQARIVSWHLTELPSYIIM